jgi:hypothetical protein
LKSAEKGHASIDPHGWDAGKKVKGKKYWTPPAAPERFLRWAAARLCRLRQHVVANRAATVAATLGALERVGARDLISAGRGHLAREDPPSTVFTLEEAPHDWLFPPTYERDGVTFTFDLSGRGRDGPLGAGGGEDCGLDTGIALMRLVRRQGLLNRGCSSAWHLCRVVACMFISSPDGSVEPSRRGADAP